MAFLEPVTLQGAHARLEPLSKDQCDGLMEAVRDGELWKLWYTFIPTAENMRKEIDRRLGLFAAGSMLPFTVYDAEGRIAGMTTYMNVDAANRLARDFGLTNVSAVFGDAFDRASLAALEPRPTIGIVSGFAVIAAFIGNKTRLLVDAEGGGRIEIEVHGTGQNLKTGSRLRFALPRASLSRMAAS